MLKNRIRGLWNVYHAILALVLTVLYWVFLIALSPMPVAHYPPFILYNVAAVFGLIIGAIRNRSSAATLLVGGFVNYHKLALKQTVYIGVVLLLALALGMEPEFRRATCASPCFWRLGCVYVAFLICHFLIPGKLADQLFSDQHEQRTLLVGPVDKARAMNRWILETSAFGFGLRGKPSEATRRGARAPVPRVSSVSMLDRIIRHEGIRQILLLELPLDPDALNLVVNAANKAGVPALGSQQPVRAFSPRHLDLKLHDKEFIICGMRSSKIRFDRSDQADSRRLDESAGGRLCFASTLPGGEDFPVNSISRSALLSTDTGGPQQLAFPASLSFGRCVLTKAMKLLSRPLPGIRVFTRWGEFFEKPVWMKFHSS